MFAFLQNLIFECSRGLNIILSKSISKMDMNEISKYRENTISPSDSASH